MQCCDKLAYAWHSCTNIIAKAEKLRVATQGTQLFIRSFELGVLFLPSLEAAYRQHPNRLFTCTPNPDQARAAAGSDAAALDVHQSAAMSGELTQLRGAFGVQLSQVSCVN